MVCNDDGVALFCSDEELEQSMKVKVFTKNVSAEHDVIEGEVLTVSVLTLSVLTLSVLTLSLWELCSKYKQ